MKFPAHVGSDAEAVVVVTLRDFPEAIIQGDTEVDAYVMAADVLMSAMEIYFDETQPIPLLSKAKRGEHLASLPLRVASKVLLLNEMLSQGVAPTQLTRCLGTPHQNVNRLIDLKPPTKTDGIEEALAALGKNLKLEIA